jgi:hypothetical protein
MLKNIHTFRDILIDINDEEDTLSIIECMLRGKKSDLKLLKKLKLS